MKIIISSKCSLFSPWYRWNVVQLALGFMVLYATFNNLSVISWRSVLLVEETRIPRENHCTSHWTTTTHSVNVMHHNIYHYSWCKHLVYSVSYYYNYNVITYWHTQHKQMSMGVTLYTWHRFRSRCVGNRTDFWSGSETNCVISGRL